MGGFTLFVSLLVCYFAGWGVCYFGKVLELRKSLNLYIERYCETQVKFNDFIDKMSDERFKSRGTFKIFKDKRGEWRFNLQSTNGRVVAVSEGYEWPRDAKRGMNAVIKACSGTPKVRVEK